MSALDDYFTKTANDYGVPLGLARKILGRESGGSMAATSAKGASGYMQLMPGTASQLGVDIRDPQQNIEGGLRYLGQLYNKYGDWQTAAAAYNAGPGRIDAVLAGKAKLPAETKAYVGKIFGNQGADTVKDRAPSDASDIEKQFMGDPQADAPSDIEKQFIQPDPSTQEPAGPPKYPMGTDQGVYNKDNKSPATDAQAKTYRMLQQNGSLDLKATPGSEALPLMQTSQAELPKPGQWFVDLAGNKAMVPQHLKSDEVAGFLQGMTRPLASIDALAHQVPVAGDLLDGFSRFASSLPNYDPATGKIVAGTPQTISQAAAAEKQFNAQRAVNQGIVPGKIGDFAGSVVAGLPVAAVAPEGMAGALVSGGVQGGLNTEKRTLGGVLGDVASGAAFGGALHGAVSGITGALAPRFSPEQTMLRDAGVTFTPGQAMNNGSAIGNIAKNLEDNATGIPVLGPLIQGARRAGYQQYTRGAFNNVMDSIGQTVPETMTKQQALGFTRGAIGDVYDGALSRMPNIGLDSQFAGDLGNIAQNNLVGLSDAEKKSFSDIVSNVFKNRVDPQTNAFAPQMWKDADSVLGENARDYLGSISLADRKIGAALMDTRGSLRDLLARQAPDDVVNDVNNANLAWAKLQPVELAASSKGSTPDFFTPNQLDTGTLRSDFSKNNNLYGQGQSLMQDYANAGDAILPSSVPDSGTAGRALTQGALGSLIGGGGLLGANAATGGAALPAVAATLASPAGIGAAAGTAGLGLLYSPVVGAKIMAAAMADRPAIVQGAGEAMRGFEGASNAGGLFGGTQSAQDRQVAPSPPPEQDIQIDASTDPAVVQSRVQRGLSPYPWGSSPTPPPGWNGY